MKAFQTLLSPLICTSFLFFGTATAAALENFSATDLQVENSQCRYPIKKSLKDIKTYFREKENSSEKANFSLLGFNFKNESPFYIQHFRDLIEPSEHTRYVQESEKLQKARNLCQSVRCVLSQVMGEEESLKALYILDKFRFNVAPYKYYDAGFFKSEDLDIILETLELIPPHLQALSEVQQLTHAHENSEQDEYTHADASISIYKVWDKNSRARKKYVLFHEIAHNWSDVKVDQLDESPTWLAITQWEKIPAGFSLGWSHPYSSYSDQHKYPWVSRYAATNSWEDFAESVSAYRFTPESLHAKSPTRYQFIKDKVFGGIEFKDNKNCHLKTLNKELALAEQKAVDLLKYKINIYDSRNAEIASVGMQNYLLDACSEELKNTLLTKKGGATSFNNCFKKTVSASLINDYKWTILDSRSKTLKTDFARAKKIFLDTWLKNTFIKNNMTSIKWSATKDFSCSHFSKNYTAFYKMNISTLEPSLEKAPKTNQILAPTIGYWICLDSKYKKMNVSTIDESRFDYLKNWLYPQLGL